MFKLATILTTLLIALMLTMPTAQAVDDVTGAANALCRTTFGITSPVTAGLGAGLRANGNAIITCPIAKKVGGELNSVLANVNRSALPGFRFCILMSNSRYSTQVYGTSDFPSNNPGNQTLDLPVPTLSLDGYLHLVCALSENDILYGIRVVQD